MRWTLTVLVVGLLLVAAVVALIVYAQDRTPVTSMSAATAPVAPATQAQAKQPTEPSPIVAWVDLLRTLPGMADATVTERRFPLENCAHIRFPHWAYICPRGDLWVSHPDGRELAHIEDEPPRGVHISRQQVVFVHWARVGRQYRPNAVFREASGAFALQMRNGKTLPLQRRDYHWQYAMSLADAIVAPTDTGVAVISVGDEVEEVHQTLSETPAGIPHIELTPGGFLAWIAMQSADSTGHVAHYSAGRFQPLASADWSQPIVHLVPFTDGSVLQVIAKGSGKVQLRTVALESSPADAATVRQFVEQLSDEDPVARDEAQAALAQMGPSAWKLLNDARSSESAEATLRIEHILSSASRPLLGRFEIVNDELMPVWRLRDGVVFLATSGARVGGSDRPGSVITPAWISVRRGKPITVLPPTLSGNLAIGPVTLHAYGSEWVLADKSLGAQWFFGQELLSLTSDEDREYQRLAGIDRFGRIVLARSEPEQYQADFLVIDPAVPDPKPVVRVWTMDVSGGKVGWDAKDWPAVARGPAYTLHEEGWETLEGELITTAPGPTTRPGGRGALRKAEGTSSQGTVWIGDNEMELVRPDGTSVRQPRPEAIPRDIMASVVMGENLYVLHGEQGLIRVRISGGDRPFAVDARFSDRWPEVWNVRRAWADPAGRICIATEESLMVVFPDQQVPPTMLDIIPSDELKQVKGAP